MTFASPFVRSRKMFFRLCVLLIAILMLVSSGRYLIDARLRHAAVPSCEWHSVPKPATVSYRARYCWLSKEALLLRLYDEDDQLVAERAYRHFDLPRFFWNAQGLRYVPDEGEDLIEIPPTFLDRLRARFP